MRPPSDPKAFLSGLGVMGRRHLLGLVRAGYSVTAWEPRSESRQAAYEALKAAGLPAEKLECADRRPTGDFGVAVFAETAPFRLDNLSDFLSGARAERFLLEKPLTADPSQLGDFWSLFEAKGIAPPSVAVNLSRRTWPLFRKLKEWAASERHGLTWMVNGGATGFGCNGIHHLDTLLYVTGITDWTIRFAALYPTEIGSGRGPEFRDYGVDFLLENGGNRFHASLAAESSAAPVLTVKGEHFIGWFDEGDVSYRLKRRRADSVKPNYLCGHDYSVDEEGTVPLRPMDELTELWSLDRLELPSLRDALAAHGLLFAVLEAAGAPRPYRFT